MMSNKSKGRKHKHCWHEIMHKEMCEIGGFLKFTCEDRLISKLPEDVCETFELCCKCGRIK